MTEADAIVEALRRAGVVRLFGMPGGGSTADLMEAARQAGLPFTLAQTETGSAFMACAQAEITGAPAACVATLGPGAASLVNGVAHAWLDRVPLAVLTDCLPAELAAMAEHQRLPHRHLFGPITKVSVDAAGGDPGALVADALRVARDGAPGPVHVDVSPAVTGRARNGTGPSSDPATALSAGTMVQARRQAPSAALPSHAVSLLTAARRPVLLVGLGARSAATATALRALADTCHVPALVTYKAKGVIPDTHPWWGGVVTHGAIERPLLEQADVFVAVGFDPVELLPRPWRYPAPVVTLDAWPLEQAQLPVAASAVGALPALLAETATALGGSTWTASAVAAFAGAHRNAMRIEAAPGALHPHDVVALVAEHYAGCRVTVDAGAHMFPVMSLWPARDPSGVLISNGLATMGFALPSAIGAALLDAPRPVVAFTGDGGLLMCLGELKTAARERVRIRVVVLDDGALSLIRIKQEQRRYGTDGTSLGPVDWIRAGDALGLVSRQVTTAETLRQALAETAGVPGPVLIAATVTPAGYPETMRVLRG